MDIQRWYHLLTINVFWFGVSFMWNALHPIVLPMLLLSFIGEKAKNTHYGLITFAGLVVALLVQPLSGAMSDFTRHRLGRRRPWIIAGSLLNIVWLIGLIVARNYWVIAGSYILLQFTSNLGHGPAQGIIPDIVPREQRGIAAGAKGLMEMMGTIAAAVLAGRIVGAAFAQPGGMIGIIIAVILVVLAITWRGVKETPLQDDAAPTRFTMEWARAVLRIDIRNNRAYARLLLVRFCVLLGTYSVQSFGFYYFSDVHQVESPARVVGNLMTAIAISILVAAYPAGVLSQRWGRKKLSIMALILVGTGMSLLAFTGNMAGLWDTGLHHRNRHGGVQLCELGLGDRSGAGSRGRQVSGVLEPGHCRIGRRVAADGPHHRPTQRLDAQQRLFGPVRHRHGGRPHRPDPHDGHSRDGGAL